MAKQQKNQQFIFKIHSALIRQNNYDLTLPLEEARKIPGLVVSLADSQNLTWINELNDTTDSDVIAKTIKEQIDALRKGQLSAETQSKIRRLYQQLYKAQFREDYLCVIMDKKSDYKRLNKGFKVNGISYKRLICTTNGVKTSTVVYVSERLYPELRRRIDNGRNQNVPLVPAKLGAYESLTSSASIPVSWPRDRDNPIPGGVIVVSDCLTQFEADLINIDTSDKSKEPVVQYVRDQRVTNNCSDGCSMMMPSLSRRWNGELNGDLTRTIAGVNLRCAWLKGMAFTFDYVEFAEKVVGASASCPNKYLITDVWGDRRDVRDADLIITESQLKLWNCYDSWEDYYTNCLRNRYTFRVAKTAPEELDDIRQLNYQFIQSLDMSDKDIEELVSPTVDEIEDIMARDPRKSIVYLCGTNLTDQTVLSADPCAKAMMVNHAVINDGYVQSRISQMIQKRIRQAKIGVLNVHGNFQLLSGDLYALCEDMFGLEPWGLLNSGEIYSKYWRDRRVGSVLCFRAPMSNAHAILRQNISFDEKAAYWFRYIDTCVVVNGWDTAPMALNGFDFDGDLLFTTDNAAMMRVQRNLPALNCLQQKANKKIVEEADIVQANLQGFGSKIGQITNRITAITSLMANYDEDSEEYQTLMRRTQIGQALQQEEID